MSEIPDTEIQKPQLDAFRLALQAQKWGEVADLAGDAVGYAGQELLENADRVLETRANVPADAWNPATYPEGVKKLVGAAAIGGSIFAGVKFIKWIKDRRG